jgi:hypothetical protein
MNYKEKLNAFRVKDADGDLSYTVHIDNAIEVCSELENKYLNLENVYLKSMLVFAEKNKKEIESLKEIIRSAHEIAKRENNQEKTNWEAFAKQCENVLNQKEEQCQA